MATASRLVAPSTAIYDFWYPSLYPPVDRILTATGFPFVTRRNESPLDDIVIQWQQRQPLCLDCSSFSTVLNTQDLICFNCKKNDATLVLDRLSPPVCKVDLHFRKTNNGITLLTEGHWQTVAEKIQDAMRTESLLCLSNEQTHTVVFDGGAVYASVVTNYMTTGISWV